jgi:soluble lytic murein transglycosylase-like protein
MYYFVMERPNPSVVAPQTCRGSRKETESLPNKMSVPQRNGADMPRHFLSAAIVLAIAVSAVSAFAKDRRAVPLDSNGNLDALIAKHAASNNVPVALVRRVIHRESGGNPRVVHAGNYGLMQIKLATARAMGYRGGAAGLLDADTNMTYAVKYLAGAYRAAGGNMDRAVHYYAAGYYYAAKRKGLLDRHSGNPINAFASEAAGGTSIARGASKSHKAKLREARATGAGVSSSSSLYTGRLDYF